MKMTGAQPSLVAARPSSRCSFRISSPDCRTIRQLTSVLLIDRPFAGSNSIFSAAQKIQNGSFGQDRLRDAVTRRSSAFFRSLRSLEISAKMARPFDDFLVFRQSLALEAAQRGLHILGIQRRGKRCGIVRRLRNSGGNVWTGDKGCIADDRRAPEGEVRALEIVD